MAQMMHYIAYTVSRQVLFHYWDNCILFPFSKWNNLKVDSRCAILTCITCHTCTTRITCIYLYYMYYLNCSLVPLVWLVSHALLDLVKIWRKKHQPLTTDWPTDNLKSGDATASKKGEWSLLIWDSIYWKLSTSSSKREVWRESHIFDRMDIF